MIEKILFFIVILSLIYFLFSYLLNKKINNTINSELRPIVYNSLINKYTNEELKGNEDEYIEREFSINIDEYIKLYLKEKYIYSLSLVYSYLFDFKMGCLLLIKFLKEQLANILTVLILASLLLGNIEYNEKRGTSVFNVPFLYYFLFIFYFSVIIYLINLYSEYFIKNKKHLNEILLSNINDNDKYKDIKYQIYLKDIGTTSPLFCFIGMIFILSLFVSIHALVDMKINFSFFKLK